MQVQVNKAVFVETGTYNDMTLRPYQTNLEQSLVNQFKEATLGGTSVSSTTLAGIANQFLKPSAQAQNAVSIDNGWGTPRLRFILDITYPTTMGPSVRKILQGYTSHVGIDMNGNIDPSMWLNFNNVITLRGSMIETPYGSSIRSIVSEANHLIRGNYDMGYDNSSTMMTMRPEDIFSTMGRLSLGSDTTDLRMTFADNPVKKSRRKNGSASHYVSDVINGYRKIMDVPGYDGIVDYNAAMTEARGTVQEDTISADPFFNELILKTSSFTIGGNITYGELSALSPAIDHNAVFIPIKQVVKTSQDRMFGVHQAGQTEHWHGSGNETLWATILSQSLPSIMMDLMLTRIGFMATNQTLDGSFDVKLLDAGSFADNIDLSPYLDIFIHRLNNEILKGISCNNNIEFAITGLVDVVGETRLTISVAGGYPVDFATPSFCDALFAPVLTTDSNSITSNAFDLQMLSDNVGVESMHRFSDSAYGGNNGVI